MDLYCTRCGEPWDNDTFHEAAKEQDTTYRDVMRRFSVEGCKAIGWSTCNTTPDTETDEIFGLTKMDMSAALFDILGDDTDGIASMMDDCFGGGDVSVIITNAPDAYDYGYCQPLPSCDTERFGSLRAVDVPHTHVHYQVGRYQSGLYVAFTGDTYDEAVAAARAF